MAKNHNTSFSIFKKIFAALLLVQLIPIVILLYTLDQRGAQHRANVEKDLVAKARLMNAEIERWLTNELKAAQFSRDLPAFKALNIQEMTVILAQIKRQSESVKVVEVRDLDGQPLVKLDNDVSIDFYQSDFFQDASRGEIGQQVFTFIENRPPLACFGFPIYSDQDLIQGVLSQCLSLNIIFNPVARLNKGQMSMALLVDDQSQIIASSLQGSALQTSLQELSSDHPLFNANIESLIEFSSNSKNYIGIKVDAWLDWQLLIQLAYSEAFNRFDVEKKSVIFFSFILLVLSLLIAYVVGNRIANGLTLISLYDPLTNIPNRRLFDELLMRTTRRCRRNNSSFVVAHVDIRSFKAINDTYGHHAGDKVLVALASLIQCAIRDYDVVARFGGDEFVVLFDDSNKEDIGGLADTLLKTCNAVVDVDGEAIKLNVNLGFAIYPDHGDNTHQLIKAADSAFYASKNRGEEYGIYHEGN